MPPTKLVCLQKYTLNSKLYNRKCKSFNRKEVQMKICISGLDGKESACNEGDLVRSLGRKDPLGMEWQPTPVLLPAEFYGQRSHRLQSIQFMGLQRDTTE